MPAGGGERGAAGGLAGGDGGHFPPLRDPAIAGGRQREGKGFVYKEKKQTTFENLYFPSLPADAPGACSERAVPGCLSPPLHPTQWVSP